MSNTNCEEQLSRLQINLWYLWVIVVFFSNNLYRPNFHIFYLTRGNFWWESDRILGWRRKMINETSVICVRSKANSSLVSCCIPPSYKKRNKYARNVCFIMFLKQSNLVQVLLISLSQAVAISVRPWLIHSNFVFQFTTTI